MNKGTKMTIPDPFQIIAKAGNATIIVILIILTITIMLTLDRIGKPLKTDTAPKGIISLELAKDKRILKDPAPTVALVELADSSVNFVVRPWVKTSDYWDVYFTTHEALKKRMDAEGISIPFPQRDVHIYQHGEGDKTGA